MSEDAISVSVEVVELNYPCPVCGGSQFILRFESGDEGGPFCVECDKGSGSR